MKKISKVLEVWNKSLVSEISLGSLYSRNPTAHKWKVTYRSIVLRELTFWRVTDLLNQILILVENGHILGARILLRSIIETVGILVYINQKTQAVTSHEIQLEELSKITTKLMLGSKNSSTTIQSINVTHTILEKWCKKKYPNMVKLYYELCESAHPNYEGVCNGYSYVNENDYQTVFENRWNELHENNLEDFTLDVMRVFDEEYNNIWQEHFVALEKFLVKNDEELEPSKGSI